MSTELAILDFIQAHLTSGALDRVMVAFSTIGNLGLIWFILAAVLLFLPRYRRAGLCVIIALVLAGVLCNLVLKPLVMRIRPCDVNTTVTLLISRPVDYSFPSGHTMASFAAVTALYLSKVPKKIWVTSLVVGCIIAFSRLYLYVHWPTDVLAGLIIGIFVGWIAWMILKLVRPRSVPVSE